MASRHGGLASSRYRVGTGGFVCSCGTPTTASAPTRAIRWLTVMKTMKIMLIAVYAIAAGLVLLGGVVYPQVKEWSYWAAGVCGLHGLLSFIVASVKMADAGRIAAWCWQGISSLFCVGLLLTYARTQHGGWLLTVAALGGFTLLATLVLALVLKPDSAAGR